MSDFTLEFAAEQVIDEPSLILFIKQLIATRRDDAGEITSDQLMAQMESNDGLFGWENVETEKFLMALAQWSKSSTQDSKYYEVLKNPWTRFAHLLLSGIFVELKEV